MMKKFKCPNKNYVIVAFECFTIHTICTELACSASLIPTRM